MNINERNFLTSRNMILSDNLICRRNEIIPPSRIFRIVRGHKWKQSWVSTKEMDLAARVQNLDEAVCILNNTSA